MLRHLASRLTRVVLCATPLPLSQLRHCVRRRHQRDDEAQGASPAGVQPLHGRPCTPDQCCAAPSVKGRPGRPDVQHHCAPEGVDARLSIIWSSDQRLLPRVCSFADSSSFPMHSCFCNSPLACYHVMSQWLLPAKKYQCAFIFGGGGATQQCGNGLRRDQAVGCPQYCTPRHHPPTPLTPHSRSRRRPHASPPSTHPHTRSPTSRATRSATPRGWMTLTAAATALMLGAIPDAHYFVWQLKFHGRQPHTVIT